MLFAPFAQSQTTSQSVHTEVIEKIKEEGMQRSKVMDSISYMTDVYGPRLTGSPQTKVAGEWAKKQFEEWGLQDAHLESWGPFGRGWSLKACSVNMIEPNFSSIIAYPKAWTPSTPKTIRAVPIYLDASTSEELEKYRGKLGRAIVLIAPPREVKGLFEAPGTRITDSELLSLANADPNSPRRRRPTSGNSSPTSGTSGANTSAASAPSSASPSSEQPSSVASANTASSSAGTSSSGDPSMQSFAARTKLQADKWQLCYDEGAAVVLEPGRGDGGTVFVQSATMPRAADPSGRANPMFRGPRPWATDPPTILPQLVLSAEHYNRLVRMIQKGAAPKLEIDIETQYHDEDHNSFNVIAEIPGTDLKDEVVMLGGHFDSWHAGTGATDNAVGCGVAMEAVRILKSIDAKPRRTIRVALWTGEEQGLYGSRAYVSDHFGSVKTPSREGSSREAESSGSEGQRSKPTYELKPEFEKLSAYFNLDNGTGKIRGIYLQGNEAVRPIFRAWLNPFTDLGATTVTSSNTGGTDHQSFDSIGLPGFQFIQDPIEYDTRTHHSSMDVYERVQADDVKQASIIMASFVYHTAMLDEKLPRKPLSGNIEKATPKSNESAAAPAATKDGVSASSPAIVPALPAVQAVPATSGN
jgi:carboxypeptidase Q